MNLTLIIVLSLGTALLVTAAVVTLIAVRHAPVGFETDEGFKLADGPGTALLARRPAHPHSIEAFDHAA